MKFSGNRTGGNFNDWGYYTGARGVSIIQSKTMFSCSCLILTGDYWLAFITSPPILASLGIVYYGQDPESRDLSLIRLWAGREPDCLRVMCSGEVGRRRCLSAISSPPVLFSFPPELDLVCAYPHRTVLLDLFILVR